jgi:hypothetical protein
VQAEWEQAALQVPGLEQVSIVSELESAQAALEEQAMPHNVWVQLEEQVPGSRQASTVREFESAQAASELQAIAQAIGVFTQAAVQVPAFEHVSVVEEFESSHPEFELHAIGQAVFEPAAEHFPGLLQTSMVSGFESAQLALESQAGMQ